MPLKAPSTAGPTCRRRSKLSEESTFACHHRIAGAGKTARKQAQIETKSAFCSRIEILDKFAAGSNKKEAAAPAACSERKILFEWDLVKKAGKQKHAKIKIGRQKQEVSRALQPCRPALWLG